jgi:hypothetical protein
LEFAVPANRELRSQVLGREHVSVADATESGRWRGIRCFFPVTSEIESGDRLDDDCVHHHAVRCKISLERGDRLTQIPREVFGDNFPGSALITISALAVPDAKIEIQGYAVIGGK